MVRSGRWSISGSASASCGKGTLSPGRLPAGTAVDLSKWRDATPSAYFSEIAGKFKKAGILLYAYDFQFHETFTDHEIERGLQIGQELGGKCMVTSSATVSLAKRMAPFIEKYKLPVGMHGRTNVKDPNEFAGPESFVTAMGYSKYIGVNLDLGHYTAAGFDAVAFIEKHHDRILSIHLKDRQRNEGRSMPFGEGDTPIRECLQLLKRNRWKIPAHIEHDRGGDRVAEFKNSYEFCKQALAVH